MKTLTYQLMTPAHWQQLTSKLEDIFALTIKTASGSSCHWGFGFKWCYDAVEQSLNLQCIKKPAWMPDALLETKIDTLVAKILSCEQPINELSPEDNMYGGIV